MTKRLDVEIGARFNRLTVLATVADPKRCLCLCACGNRVELKYTYVRSGNTKSCGCLGRDARIARNKRNASRGGLTHSHSGKSWNAMMSRCFNEKYHDYATYGAVGIKPCAFIAESPANLIATIGERIGNQSLDRIDGSGGYTCGKCPECLSRKSPLNIRWATSVQQTRNQRSNHLLEINGLTMCFSDWAKRIGINESSLRYRIARGWTGERLISGPRRNPYACRVVA